YTAGNDNYQSESEHNTASFSGITRLARTLALDYSHSYDDAFDRQIRTGNFTDHTVNTTDVELTGQYGVKNIYSAGLRYMVDDYDAVSDDSFTQIEPHARLTHWMTPMSGIATSIAYKDKDFDDQGGDEQTLSADIRYIRVLSRNFDVYAKYRHSYADTDAYEHHIFHPSVGFDWAVDKTSGVSMGAGFLFHDWSNDNDDDTDLFLDLDAYKRFEFSPRMQLAFTASSGYSESNETAASLGYNIHYRAGGRFNYRLTRQLSSNLFTAYQVTDYQETAQDRKDEEIIAGASLSWLPVKWLQFNLEYRYTDFSTNTTEREDYAQNTALLTVRFFPEKPIRFDSPVSRNTLETFLFD
ncbi:MAG: outer membrane beta-barrel protein, partial [Desulfobacterales bacterium]|nr:outer membrane beta-barrel protein [Desulfobacterales bacterium]